MRQRRRHRTAIALTGALTVAAMMLAVSVAAAPDVAGAPAAVVAVDRAHGAEPAEIATSDRIAVAVVAAEDDGFYTNNGVDMPALARSAWGYLRGVDAGGSTIEMQLAHLLYPEATQGVWGRIHRVALAMELDTIYSKASILSMYLSAAYFGHGYYGIEAASRGYFGVVPAALGWGQAAMLAGLVQAPSALDPLAHLAAARQRMGYVLGRLVADNRLSPAEAAQIVGSPLGLRTSAA